MNLKKMIVVATLSSIVLMVLIISVFAAWSPNYVLLCPKFGGWSNPSPRVQKTDSNNAVYKVMAAPHFLPIYGDLISNATGERTTEEYYQVWAGYSVDMSYISGYGNIGSYHQARIASSDFEPDSRNVTIKFKP
ncbi:MAG: hypothetical protein SPI53_05635 [Erysipelotrichaceae bacterium]|nr:hypothetical protein [Erysipelotrichaceae bacterium]